MRKSMKLLIATVLATLLTAPAFAGNDYLGPGDAAAAGDEGVLGCNKLCNDEFLGSQMCRSADILQSGDLEATGSANNRMWVLPDIVGYANDDSTDAFDAVDASGIDGDPQDDLSCKGWTDGTSASKGLFMTDDGGFGTQTCDTSSEPACCNIASGFKKVR